jgi:hypothetical protein
VWKFDFLYYFRIASILQNDDVAFRAGVFNLDKYEQRNSVENMQTQHFHKFGYYLTENLWPRCFF